MATVLRLRDEVDVLRLIDCLVEASTAVEDTDPAEARARLILSNRLADELDTAERRGLLRGR